MGLFSKLNVIHIPTFQSEYKTGLVFSMIEGLKLGSSLKLICDQDPFELEDMLTEAHIENLSWKKELNGQSHWELTIIKEL